MVNMKIIAIISFVVIISGCTSTSERIERWSIAHVNDEYSISHVDNDETALLAFKEYYSYGSNYLIKQAADNLTIDDVYYGKIRNVKKTNYINDSTRYVIDVWRVNTNLLYNVAVDENGTIYIGCLLYGSQLSECGRVP